MKNSTFKIYFLILTVLAILIGNSILLAQKGTNKRMRNLDFLAAGSSDEQAIARTLRNYIDGPNEKNVVKLKSAFARTATIFYVRDSKLVEIKLGDFFRHIEAGWADPQEHVVVARAILLIDVFDKAAMAKIQANFPDGKAVDYISLLKIDDQWKIVNKIFSFK